MRGKFLMIVLLLSFLGKAQYVQHAYNFSLDNFPSVYGGKPEWKRFLRDHMIYPEVAIKEKAEGTVLVSFVVTADGKSLDRKIINSVSNEIDAEALRLVSLLEWAPSTQGGTGVNVNHSVEINFSISKYKKWVKERGYEKCMFNDLPSDSSLAIYETFDKPAVFFDKEKTYPEFIYSNLEYPEEARKQGVEGKINMTFIIEPNGAVSNIRIKDGGLGLGCDDEAIRVIGLTRWQPAIKNGKYVRFRMSYTMVFSVKNSFKDNSAGS
ncbi:MAG: TonB family protein, partial [Bacteroidia bacterium]